jgi:hypothetical protein
MSHMILIRNRSQAARASDRSVGIFPAKTGFFGPTAVRPKNSLRNSLIWTSIVLSWPALAAPAKILI